MQLMRSRDVQKQREGFLSRMRHPSSVWWPLGSSPACLCLCCLVLWAGRRVPADSQLAQPTSALGDNQRQGGGSQGVLPPPSLGWQLLPLLHCPRFCWAPHPSLPSLVTLEAPALVHLWWPHRSLVDFLPVPSLVQTIPCIKFCLWYSELLLLSCLALSDTDGRSISSCVLAVERMGTSKEQVQSYRG